MIRIIWHWTGGTGNVSAMDRAHYHFIIDQFGTVIDGIHPPEVNEAILHPNDATTYAAHTRGCNTGAIGIALAGMHGAQERPFRVGDYPINSGQLYALTRLCAQLCKHYAIPVARATTLGHSEVPGTLGIQQTGKWDINWLPGMKAPGDPTTVGDKIRNLIRAELKPIIPPREPKGFLAAFFTRMRKRP